MAKQNPIPAYGQQKKPKASSSTSRPDDEDVVFMDVPRRGSSQFGMRLQGLIPKEDVGEAPTIPGSKFPSWGHLFLKISRRYKRERLRLGLRVRTYEHRRVELEQLKLISRFEDLPKNLQKVLSSWLPLPQKTANMSLLQFEELKRRTQAERMSMVPNAIQARLKILQMQVLQASTEEKNMVDSILRDFHTEADVLLRNASAKAQDEFINDSSIFFKQRTVVNDEDAILFRKKHGVPIWIELVSSISKKLESADLKFDTKMKNKQEKKEEFEKKKREKEEYLASLPLADQVEKLAQEKSRPNPKRKSKKKSKAPQPPKTKKKRTTQQAGKKQTVKKQAPKKKKNSGNGRGRRGTGQPNGRKQGGKPSGLRR